MNFKQTVKQLLPPILLNFFKVPSRYGWFGKYSSWSEAKEKCDGYNSEVIFKKAKAASKLVRLGQAKFERDTVLFFQEDFNWPILSCLMAIAAREKSLLHVTDFGGALASFFYQHLKFIKMVKKVRWSIIEQAHIVEYGKQDFSDEILNFFATAEECLQQQEAQTLLLSSVLQYLKDPIAQIKELVSLNYRYILIDRTAFTNAEDHEITIQKINPKIYDASYPSWFFNEQKFLKMFKDYNIALSFTNSDYTNKKDTFFKGYFLIKKSDQDEKAS